MTETSSPTVYVTYARCAASDPSDPDPIEEQQAGLRAYVTANGGTIVAEFSDRDASGDNLDRRGMYLMMDRLSAGGVDAVLVADPIRLARGNAFAVVEQQFGMLGVRIEDASGQSTEPDYPMFGIPQLFNLMWAKRTSEMTKAKLTQMAADGYFTGGKIPFGFKAEVVPGVRPSYSKPPTRLVPDDTEVPVVRAAFDLYIKQPSLRATQNFLNEATVGGWSTPRTRRFLSNSVYEPIVTHEIFQEVQRILALGIVKRKA